MDLLKTIRSKFTREGHHPTQGGLEILKYIGPGLLVTVGFIDPGNWASNLAAGADYGYALLWMVTLSTIMLILLQHNVAPSGDRHRTLPFGGCSYLFTSCRLENRARFGHACIDLHLAG